MRRAGTRSFFGLLVVAAAPVSAVLAVAWLALRAAGDVWRSPALLPQQWGTRGVQVALDNGLAEATRGSFVIATVAASLGCALLLPAAAVIDSIGPRLRLVAIIMILLPIVLPGSLVGLGIATFNTRIGIPESLLTIVLAHLPFVIAWQAVALLGAWDRSLRARIDAAAANGVPGTGRRAAPRAAGRRSRPGSLRGFAARLRKPRVPRAGRHAHPHR